MTKSTYSIFKTCLNGHDLGGENAFIYDNSGKRTCRQCAVEANNSKKVSRKRGSLT